MTTARDIIEGAARKIHVLGRGSSLSADEAQNFLTTLNSMLATFSAEGGLVYTQTTETFNLTSAQSYTIGVGADFDTARPLFFNAVYVTQGDTDYSLKEMDAQEYAAIMDKDEGGGIPESYFFDANYPVGTIFLYPTPVSTPTITLYSFKQLTSFTSLSDTFTMPPEYEAFLVHNLAVWIAPEYEREAAPTIKSIAKQTRESILAQNKRNEKWLSDLDVPSRSGNTGNIYTGFYN